MNAAIEYLRKREWAMGNGQCHDCHGVPPKWHGHPLHKKADSIGHKPDCTMAASLRALGETPLMLGEFTSDIEYESYITEGGFLATRPKTATGCPKIAKMNADMEDAVYGPILDRIAAELAAKESP